MGMGDKKCATDFEVLEVNVDHSSPEVMGKVAFDLSLLKRFQSNKHDSSPFIVLINQHVEYLRNISLYQVK